MVKSNIELGLKTFTYPVLMRSREKGFVVLALHRKGLDNFQGVRLTGEGVIGTSDLYPLHSFEKFEGKLVLENE